MDVWQREELVREYREVATLEGVYNEGKDQVEEPLS